MRQPIVGLSRGKLNVVVMASGMKFPCSAAVSSLRG